MGYQILNPSSYKVIGSARFADTGQWVYLCEPEQWAAEQGATYRWISFAKFPYLIVDGAVQNNPFFVTGPLKLKAGAKRVFHIMNDDEQWMLETVAFSEIHMFEKPLFVGCRELYFSDGFKSLGEDVRKHVVNTLEIEVQQNR